jgi:hypothetical protein
MKTSEKSLKEDPYYLLCIVCITYMKKKMAPKCFGICLDCWAEVPPFHIFQTTRSVRNSGKNGQQHVMKNKADFPINGASKQ